MTLDELGAADAAALRASLDELEKAQVTHPRTYTRARARARTRSTLHTFCALPVPYLPPQSLHQQARGWQAESATETEPDELRAQLQGFWRLLFTSSTARARDGVTGYGALYSAFTSCITQVHYTAMSALYSYEWTRPNPEPEPAPTSIEIRTFRPNPDPETPTTTPQP